jgi:arginine vasopressin receptor 1A
MLHLSIADIITAFLTLLPELIWTTTAPNFYGGNVLCKTVKFMQMVGPYLRSVFSFLRLKQDQPFALRLSEA